MTTKMEKCRLEYNNLDKMEECLEKKTGFSSLRTTTNIFIGWEDKGHKMEGEYLSKQWFCRNGSRYYRKSQVELCVKNENGKSEKDNYEEKWK